VLKTKKSRRSRKNNKQKIKLIYKRSNKKTGQLLKLTLGEMQTSINMMKTWCNSMEWPIIDLSITFICHIQWILMMLTPMISKPLGITPDIQNNGMMRSITKLKSLMPKLKFKKTKLFV